MFYSAFTLTIALLGFGAPAFADSETSSKGELRFESRFFNDDNIDNTQDFGYGLASRLEVENNNNNLNSRIQVFSRVDRKDPNRQRLNIEELFTQWVGDQWIWFAGFKTLNWSTAEAFHPSDVINSRNFDGPFENAEKLGEMMIGGQYLSDSFSINAFFMPLVARPQLPDPNNRLSFAPQGVSVGEVQFIDNEGDIIKDGFALNQWAIHMQVPMDDWEFNVYWVHHFDRTDFKTLSLGGSFVPVLNEVDHYAFSFQYVWESWIFKAENAFRDFQEQTTLTDFAMTITRNDYGISSLALEKLLPHESGSETTLILEFQGIYGVDRAVRYTINPFQRDLLLGVRHALNDEKGKELFFALIADVERGQELLASGSYTQRLSDVWKIKIGARYIDAQPQGPFDLTGIRPLDNDHQFDISLSRFF